MYKNRHKMHHASVFFLHDDFLYASYLATLTFVFNDVTLRDAVSSKKMEGAVL